LVPIAVDANQQLLTDNKILSLLIPKFSGQRPYYDHETQEYDYTRPRPCPKEPFENHLKKVEKYIRNVAKVPAEQITAKLINKTA
jgi:hypothetical protein